MARLRAHHARFDTPAIFTDELAERLITEQESEFFTRLGSEALRKLRPDLDPTQLDPAGRLRALPRTRGALAVTVARARFTEDRLAEAVENGCAQYVILGAGLDTFALRRTDLGERLHVFEVDRAAAQESKRARLAAAGIVAPANLHFLPADFERESAGEVLARSAAWRGNRSAFFSWLGVSYYLSDSAIHEMLGSIGRIAAPGSRLAFDYVDSDAFHPQAGSARVREMMEAVAELGEPMITGWDPRSLAELLASHGFRIIEAVDPRQIQARYFAGRTDGLCATEHFHLVLVEVV
jgi:methyltransferase (TIGR00027 family)